MAVGSSLPPPPSASPVTSRRREGGERAGSRVACSPAVACACPAELLLHALPPPVPLQQLRARPPVTLPPALPLTSASPSTRVGPRLALSVHASQGRLGAAAPANANLKKKKNYNKKEEPTSTPLWEILRFAPFELKAALRGKKENRVYFFPLQLEKPSASAFVPRMRL